MQIALGDLGEMSDPYLVRQALRGVDTVIHLAATIRDQPPHRIEELNGLATVRLLRAAERSGVERFVFFSALNASAAQRTRFFRAKWLAEQAVASSALRDDGLRPLDRLRPHRPLDHAAAPLLLPAGAAGLRRAGKARFQPIWAAGRRPLRGRRRWRREARPRYELAGPETLSYDQMSDLVSRIAGRPRPLVHLPLPLVRCGSARAPLHLRRGRVRYLGGGRADGGPDGQRARHGRRGGARRRAAKDERCPGGAPRQASAVAGVAGRRSRCQRRPRPR